MPRRILDGYTDHIFISIDLHDPAQPREVGRWWLPGMWQAGGETQRAGPAGWRCTIRWSPTAVAYCGWRDADSSCSTSRIPQRRAFSGRAISSRRSAAATHTALPLPRRKLVAVADEAMADISVEPQKYIWMMDVREPSNPVTIATLPLPADQDYLAKGGTFGPHNLWENRPDAFVSDQELCAHVSKRRRAHLRHRKSIPAERNGVLRAAAAPAAPRSATGHQAHFAFGRSLRDSRGTDLRNGLQRRLLRSGAHLARFSAIKLRGITIMRIKYWLAACVALACSFALAPPTQAADETTSAATGTAELSEIVVTAEKRTENLEKAPVTVSVVSGEDLTIRGIDDISEATVMFPSVKFGQISGTTHLYIRGIGAEQDRASIDPLSAMTENGINIPREATGNDIYDVSAVEVLPGPQSTLYGASAAGGIVSVVDNRPVNKEEGYAIFETGNYDLKHVTAVENMPLSDVFYVRAAFDDVVHDGYETSGAQAQDELGARISAVYAPSKDFNGYMWYSYNHTGGEPANTVTLLGTSGNHTFADPNQSRGTTRCARPRAPARRSASTRPAIPSSSASSSRISGPTSPAPSLTGTCRA